MLEETNLYVGSDGGPTLPSRFAYQPCSGEFYVLHSRHDGLVKSLKVNEDAWNFLALIKN